MKILLTGVFVLFLTVAAYANMLFENGTSSYSIVLPANANPTEKFAAEELQALLKKSGNVTLPIVSTPGQKGSNIFLKTVPNGKKLEVRDRITIKYDGGDLILQGNFSYVTLFAVYRFAEKQLGFRWLYPGDAGEFFTPKSKFELSDKVSEVFVPQIRTRCMFMVNGRERIDCEKWILHNYGNIGLRSKEMLSKVDVPRFAVTAFAELRGRNKGLFKTDPDMFSLLDGKRSELGWGGCWSNPKYVDLFVKEVFERIEKEKLDLLFMVAPDTRVRCQCAPCNAEKSQPDRWTNLFREIAKRVKARYPDVKLATCAYHEYRELPNGDIKFADIAPSFSFSNRCYIHKFNDPKCPYQKKSRDMIDSWKKKFGGDISINCYENTIFTHFLSYAPITNMLFDQMKYFAELDPHVVRTEFYMRANWARNMKWPYEFKDYDTFRLTNYIFVTMMHSPQLDGSALLKEYCNTLYGPAADLMYKYHTEFADAWDKMDIHLVWYFHNAGPVAQKLLNPELIAKFNKYFEDAEKLVKSKPEYQRYIKEIALDKFNYDLWVKYYNANSTASWEVRLGKGKDKGYNFIMKNRLVDRDGKPVSKTPSTMRTTGTIARDDNFLYIHVDCFAVPNVPLQKGEKTRDNDKLFHSENVEFLIRTDQQNDYFHFAVNPATGIYDARISDRSWNPAWEVKTKIMYDRWTADITIPFRELGYEGIPANGATWSIGVMRYVNAQHAAGFPIPIFGQITATAKVIFDESASPDRVVTFFVTQKPGTNVTLDLNNAGWTVTKESFKESEQKRSPGKEVILLTPGSPRKEVMPIFYHTRIMTALENGSLVVFNDDSWTSWQYYFGEEFPKGYYRHKDVYPTEKLYWVDSKSSAKEKAKWEYLIRSAGSSAYTPKDGWHVLASQKLKNGKDVPIMMYKQHNGGMVVLLLGMKFLAKGYWGEFMDFMVQRWKAESAAWEKQARDAGKAITMIMADPANPDRYCPVADFHKANWAVSKENFLQGWTKRSTGKEVILVTNYLPKEANRNFFKTRIDSALENGSLVIFDDNGWSGWSYLCGETYPKGYYRSKDIKDGKNFHWVDSKSTADDKKLIDDIVRTAGPYAYMPTPGWHVLAQKELKNGSFAPLMMYKKQGKGMVVLVSGMRYIKKDRVPEFINFLIKRWQQECR